MRSLATSAGTRPVRPSNRFGLDYRVEAERLGPPVVPIIDAHAHINGGEASRVYRDVSDAFGVVCTFTQTRLNQAEAVRDVMGDRVRFVAVPDFMGPDPGRAHTSGYLEDITTWHGLGARMLKFWCGPRGRDYMHQAGLDPMLMTLDHPWRREQMDHAASLGMAFMTHIADPDTWFAGKYTDASWYGTKQSQYDALERLGEEYPRLWLIAHMGGWPEDLSFVSGLLERHPNFVIDTSATKWMVRELSKHPSDELLAFLERFEGRVLFGSDIVTMDEHLSDEEGPRGMGAGATNEDEAFDLYASRYYAYRTMLETAYRGESPIADPDLMMLDPGRYDAMSAPALTGHDLPERVLKILYRSATEHSLVKWYDEH
jgi:hypothetical protein